MTQRINTNRFANTSGNTRPTYAASLTNQQLDVYTFTSIKTGFNAFSVLGSRTSYGFG
jgi:hypothetical protein